MTRSLFVLSLLLVVLAACAAAATYSVTPVPTVSPEAAARGAVTRFTSGASSVPVGSSLTVHIQLDRVADLMGAEVQIVYNPSVLEVQDRDIQQEGVQIEWGTLLKPDFVARNQVNAATGKIILAVTQAAPTPPVTGSGALAMITFKAKSAGASPLTFEVVKLAAIEGAAIECTPQNTQITVRPQ